MKRTRIATLIIIALLLIGCDRTPTNSQGTPFPTIEPEIWEALENR